VRNNLFHGEKTSIGHGDDPARNEKLIRGSIAVLRQILCLCPELRCKFNSYDW
jgi:hypothetical protein